MKKSFLLSLVLLGGCSLFTKYSVIDYNNLIVNQINETSGAIETTVTLYTQTVPDTVTEESYFPLNEMKDAYEVAEAEVNQLDALFRYKSRDLEQQNAARTELTTYQSAAEAYLESYAEMLIYYESGAYQEDITQVSVLDEELHTHYTTFIEANNDLVTTLESFVTD